jgi:hypothetical protein
MAERGSTESLTIVLVGAIAFLIAMYVKIIIEVVVGITKIIKAKNDN